MIPIPKPGKDPTNPTNNHPIALTSCIRMINRRLVWYLESHKLLTMCNVSSDQDVARLIILLDLKRFVGRLSSINQHLVSVLFYLEKTYDTTWKCGIMRDLHGIGLRGRLPNFSSCFLNDRSFKVRVGSIFF